MYRKYNSQIYVYFRLIWNLKETIQINNVLHPRHIPFRMLNAKLYLKASGVSDKNCILQLSSFISKTKFKNKQPLMSKDAGKTVSV